jgi:hypothetical protein
MIESNRRCELRVFSLGSSACSSVAHRYLADSNGAARYVHSLQGRDICPMGGYCWREPGSAASTGHRADSAQDGRIKLFVSRFISNMEAQAGPFTWWQMG